MNPLDTLYFPETIPDKAVAGQLLFFFNRIYYYRPREDDPGYEADDLWAETGLWQTYAPAPLGKDLDSFRRLLRDMSGQAAQFYQGYLSSLSGKPAADPEENSVHSLSTAINSGSGRRQVPADEEKLCQARLLLAMTEILERDEAQIEAGLAAIAARKSKMLRALQGADDPEFETETATILSGAFAPAAADALARCRTMRSPARQRQQVISWSRLFLAADKPTPPLLSTACAEATSILFETCERLSGKPPLKLFSLPLPGLIKPDDSQFLEERNTFRAATDKSRQTLASLLQKAAAGVFRESETTEPEITAALSGWQQTVNQHPTAEQPDRLSFYLCRELPLPALLRNVVGEGKNREEAGPEALPPGIFAIIGRD